MNVTDLRRIALFTVVGILTAATAPPHPAASGSDAADCTFAIRASNNLSHDVWVYLYDSKVMLDGVGILGRSTQLKIQNHRIASGKSMDRRYTAPGRCSRTRTWWIQAKRGSATMMIEPFTTSGDNTAARTIDLGPASKWKLQ